MYTYIAIHFIVQQKLTQHCEATIPQLKKKRHESEPSLLRISGLATQAEDYTLVLKAHLVLIEDKVSQKK